MRRTLCWSVRSLLFLFTTAFTAAGVGAQEVADTFDRRLDEVLVTGVAARRRVANPIVGAERLELSRLSQAPSFAGEKDIIKSLALLPGVRSEGDGGGGFEVRGGNASQNLVLLDGIKLYNPAHVMGIFSTFNDDALGSAVLYKGPFPSGFGGATSSVLDVALAAGDPEEFHGSATIGILSAKIKAAGPIVKDKLTFAVTARRSYVDAFLKLVPKYRSTVMNFYDITARLRYTPSRNHIVDGSFFAGRDNMAVGKLMGLYWGNLGASLNWLARAGERAMFTTSVSLTHYDPRMTMDMMGNNREMRTFIHSYSLNEKMNLRLSDYHAIEAGIYSELMRVKSAEWVSNSFVEREIRSLWENAVWADYSGNFADRLELTVGVRLNLASALSGARFHSFTGAASEPIPDFAPRTYFIPEPRVNLKYSLGEYSSVKAGFGISSQNLHSIRSSATSFPFDRYALTSASVRPERAKQFGAGYSGMTRNGALDWSVEAYYRDIANVYDYRDGLGSFSSIALESLILGGKGRSYGVEFMVRKNTGRLTGWVAYTLSQTRTRIPGINDGRWYNATNDRRHDFSVAAIFRLTDRWSLSGAWIFLSGQPLTAPDVKYQISGMTCYYYSGRNTYVTPPVNRLDLSAVYTHVGRKFTYEWAFGVYNAYCRYNPYIVYFEDDPDRPSGTRAVQMAMYGLVPSVSYTLKF